MINLRGVREAGAAFAAPSYFFILIMFIMIGTGLVRMPQMMKAGLWLNLTGIVLIFVLTFLVFIPVLRALR